MLHGRSCCHGRSCRHGAALSPGLRGDRLERHRIAIALVGFLLVVASVAVPAEEHRVSGRVEGIEQEGRLFVAVFEKRGRFINKETTDDYVAGRVYEVDSTDVVVYRLRGVPSGTYVLLAFLDTNDNEELDMGILGPREPWGIYNPDERSLVGRPRFDAFSFELSSDMRGADVRLR